MRMFLLLIGLLLTACPTPAPLVDDDDSGDDDDDTDDDDSGVSDDDDTVDDEAPPLQINPAAADERGHCGSVTVTFTVTNPDDEAVQITDGQVDGDGWTIGDVSWPVSIAALGEWQLEAEGTTGSAILTLTTDSTASPTLTVGLSAQANMPPSVEFTSPAAGTLEEGVDVELATLVAGEVDALAGVSADVHDDRDGPDLGGGGEGRFTRFHRLG